MLHPSRCGQRKPSNENLQGSLKGEALSRRPQRNQGAISVLYNESGALHLRNLITTHGGNKNARDKNILSKRGEKI